MGVVFLRAVIFLAVFFSLGFVLRFILNTFFPELLYIDDDPGQQDDMSPQMQSSSQMPFEQPGSRVNITLGKNGEYALPENRSSEDDQELGNIEDLGSGNIRPQSNSKGIDRNMEEDYNIESSGGSVEEDESINFEEPVFNETSASPKPVFSPSFGDDSTGLGGLPDLEAMATAFSTGFSDEPVQTHEEAEPSKTPYKGNKPQALNGDFNAEELAKGLRTVLSKDK
jgi:hypothetical protein